MSDKSYSCDCVVIPKELLGKKITPEIVHELVTNRRTKVLDGFVSKRKQKTFSAALMIAGGEVKFDFKRTGQDNEKNLVRIRVYSGNSGSAHVLIKGTTYKEFQISYGHVSSRMAECLACITAAHLVKYVLKNISGLKLAISINNLDLSRYILKERVPRDSLMKLALENLFKLLGEFGSWSAYYELLKRSRLTGSPYSNTFPKGVFPGIDVGVKEGDRLTVILPNRLDVQSQFTASIQRAVSSGDNTYALPLTARPVLMAWLNSVKKGVYQGEVNQQ
ncbi:topoisomerase C-terminal repeat-containing protein [Pelotomaculum propionicicum]